jgi:pimeloyl-ACP methyl ester carboxylesterase
MRNLLGVVCVLAALSAGAQPKPIVALDFEEGAGGYADDAAALADRSFSPKWKYPVLIENEIPVLLVYGEVDDLVPYEQNAAYLVEAYTNAGLTDILKVKSFNRGHHPHGWPGGASTYIIDNMG